MGFVRVDLIAILEQCHVVLYLDHKFTNNRCESRLAKAQIFNWKSFSDRSEFRFSLRVVRSRRRPLGRGGHRRSKAVLFVRRTLSSSGVRIEKRRSTTLLGFHCVHHLFDVLRRHFQQFLGECLNAHLFRQLILDELTWKKR